jgi:hypothetical protein
MLVSSLDGEALEAGFGMEAALDQRRRTVKEARVNLQWAQQRLESDQDPLINGCSIVVSHTD